MGTNVGWSIRDAVHGCPLNECQALRIIAERAVQFADDAHARTKGKIKTWSGFDDREDPKAQLARIKSAAGTIGTVMAMAANNEPRRTPTWVMDAIEYALGVLSWG